jgi:hypothetical protein
MRLAAAPRRAAPGMPRMLAGILATVLTIVLAHWASSRRTWRECWGWASSIRAAPRPFAGLDAADDCQPRRRPRAARRGVVLAAIASR